MNSKRKGILVEMKQQDINLSKSFKFLYLTCRERVRQRLALYQGVCPIYMEFLDDAEESFAAALAYLKVTGYPALSFCFKGLKSLTEALTFPLQNSDFDRYSVCVTLFFAFLFVKNLLYIDNCLPSNASAYHAI